MWTFCFIWHSSVYLFYLLQFLSMSAQLSVFHRWDVRTALLNPSLPFVVMVGTIKAFTITFIIYSQCTQHSTLLSFFFVQYKLLKFLVAILKLSSLFVCSLFTGRSEENIYVSTWQKK